MTQPYLSHSPPLPSTLGVSQGQERGATPAQPSELESCCITFHIRHMGCSEAKGSLEAPRCEVKDLGFDAELFPRQHPLPGQGPGMSPLVWPSTRQCALHRKRMKCRKDKKERAPGRSV